MPFCPQCRSEYREDVKMCNECRVKLVKTLPIVPDVEVEDLDVAATVSDEETAYIIRGYLESEGIPCQIENQTFHAAPAEGLVRVRLWTKKEDAARARELIEAHEDIDYCSNCGHAAQEMDEYCDFCGEKFE